MIIDTASKFAKSELWKIINDQSLNLLNHILIAIEGDIMHLRAFFLASIALLAFLLGTTGAQAAAPSAEGIVVYNTQHVSLTRAWIDAFTRETGIKVTVRNGSDTELGNQIVQEGSASPADVFLTENSPAMALVENAG